MRVLLTGSSGFIGSHVLRKILTETDWTVACPVSFKHKGEPARITETARGFDLERVNVFRCDLAAPITPTSTYQIGTPDVIINLASNTHPPTSVRQPVEFVHNNVNLMLSMLEFARTCPRLQAFFHLSTDAVYGPAPGRVFHREWDSIEPSNPYAASKAMQEALAIAYWRSYVVPVVIATTMNPIGEMQDLEKFVPSTIRKIMRGETVQIHTDAAGQAGMRQYIDVNDVADALLWLIKLPRQSLYLPTESERPERWNIAGDRNLNNLTVAQLVADGLAMPLKSEMIIVDKPELGHRYALNTSKIMRAGWTPRCDIVDTIYRTAKWTKEHPMWWDHENA